MPFLASSHPGIHNCQLFVCCMVQEFFPEADPWTEPQWFAGQCRHTTATPLSQLVFTILPYNTSIWHRSYKRTLLDTHAIKLLLISFSQDTRLSNFTIMAGAHLDWKANQRCHTQLPPVPRDATVVYPCDQILQGQVVSINKTSSPGRYMNYLVIRELKVFGYESGKDVYF